MNRYWNLTERERAGLTREQVTAFLDVELMEKGVAKVAAPQYEPTEKVEVESTPYHEVFYECDTSYGKQNTKLCFKTSEQAAAFMKLDPMIVDSNWEYGDIHFVFPATFSVSIVNRPSAGQVADMAVKLKEQKARDDRNERLKRDYDRAIKAVTEATKGVWADWNECRDKQARYQRMLDTRAEYLELTGGNAEMAEQFLLKLFSADEIAEADSWCAEER